jgi:ABC-type uncharacterized transport system involved in gliding motility auxiliary subunit
LLVTTVILAAAAAADFAVHRVRIQADLTVESSQTLSDETREVLRRLDRPVQVTAFFGRNNPDRVTASTLLLRYRRLSSQVEFRVVDPEQAPAEALRLGINPAFGGLAVGRGDEVEVAQTPTEQDVTSAIARLLRGRPRSVCYAVGHGESDPASTLGEGMRAAIELLGRSGFVVEVVDLLTRPAVPEECEAIIVANPVTPLGEAEEALDDYLSGGGRALILTDPSSTVDLNPLLSSYGIRVERGIVLENDPDLHFPDDPTRPVILSYQSPSPIVRRLPPTFFPGVQGLVTTDDVSGLTTTPVARTSPRSYLERRPLEPSFDEREDLPGPMIVVATADFSENIRGEVRRTRLAVFGDVDFATNTFVGEAGNSTLVLRALDWATGEEDLVSVSANLPQLRPLELTEGRITYVRFLLAGVVPGLFLLAGGMVWAIRRRL